MIILPQTTSSSEPERCPHCGEALPEEEGVFPVLHVVLGGFVFALLVISFLCGIDDATFNRNIGIVPGTSVAARFFQSLPTYKLGSFLFEPHEANSP